MPQQQDGPVDTVDVEIGGAASASAGPSRSLMPAGRATAASGDLKFVILSHPEDIRRQKDVQTEIRRHVMRDIGKQRRRPRPGGVSHLRMLQPPASNQGSSSMVQGVNVSNSIDRSLAPLGSFPIAGDARLVELVRFVMETSTVYIPFCSVWFQVSLSDPGAFHVTLGNAAALWKIVTENRANIHDPELKAHYSQSLMHLRARLSSVEDSITEGTIVNILAHICLNMRHHYWDSWRAHMNGLSLIYRLREGFDDLGYNTRLMILFYDLTGAMNFDSVPRFPLPPDLTTPARTIRPAPPKLQAMIADLSQASPELASAARALEMVSSVADVVNLKSHSLLFWQSDVDALKLTSPTIHFLLSMPRLPENISTEASPHNLVAREMVRLVCLMIMSKLKQNFSFFAAEWVGLQEKLDRLLIQHSALLIDQCRELRIWALVTVALLRDPVGRGVYVHELLKDMSAVDELSVDDLIGVANETLWVNCLESPFIDDLIIDIMQHMNAR
ncbi:hypothetical protein PT974_05112 [Cladobotryum mycophilum]|uniref:Uncharacterized protein n=1 Tax=Cladobotryum mycophilum TaxID=491253 RepID=A0ABR0SR25_9HYPO